jgi:hypothetical protein
MAPGAERKYTSRVYHVGAADKKVSFKEVKMASDWTKANDFYGPGASEWRYWRVNAPRDREAERYRVAGGDVEFCRGHDANGPYWCTFLKGGAEPGATWRYKRPESAKSVDYRYEKHAAVGGRPCAVVVSVEDDHGILTRAEVWLAKGVGIVRWDQYTTNPQLKQFKNSYLPVSQAVYEEWQGDVPPLEIVPVKK